MAQFDPRRQPMRLAPHIFTACAALVVAMLAGRVYHPVRAEVPVAVSAESITQLEAQAIAAAGTPVGMGTPEAIPVQIRKGETFEQAVRRTGIPDEEARAVTQTIADAYDVNELRAGLRFETAIAQPRGGRGGARLIGLTMRTGPASQLTVSRTFDGALRLRAIEEKVTHETVVVRSTVKGSIYATARQAGANGQVIRKATQLFSHKFDLDRDIRASDEFVLVFSQTVTESGRVVEAGELLYAELKGQVFYRFKPADSAEAQYFDASGKNMRSAFMRTPLDRARVSSSYGYRRHPISGYRRMHQGIDFAAGTGTPVLAPADGVVVEARRWGGYGNWLRIRHANGLETGYGHLSRYGSGIRAGVRVRQGQVVAYVGSTGASTGPHLHYEIWQNGRRINPAGVKTQEGTILGGADLAAFRAEKTRIDRVILSGGEQRPTTAGGLRRVGA
ncbi:M23 family metallopeptidase [Brevundimonas sp.]|uniref:M23 family metallopeptidase n=1 Tax=Brevundimonas sp. TaxID=1871086 RepID=UPI003AF9A010